MPFNSGNSSSSGEPTNSQAPAIAQTLGSIAASPVKIAAAAEAGNASNEENEGEVVPKSDAKDAALDKETIKSGGSASAHSRSTSTGPSAPNLSTRAADLSPTPAAFATSGKTQISSSTTNEFDTKTLPSSSTPTTSHPSSLSPHTPTDPPSAALVALSLVDSRTTTQVQQQQRQEQATGSTMNQSQPYGAPRRTATYGSQHDELHISPTMSHQAQMSPRDYAPTIKLDNSASQPATPGGYRGNSAVPNVLQPGGLSAARPPVMSANTAPSLPTMSGAIQQSPSEYSPSKAPSLSLSHGYSRSSPAAPYETSTGYSPYTPTTPGGSVPGPSQFMSPPDTKYGAPGSQRNISNTPLGLADIRPRADSTLSDTTPGTLGYELANSQPSTSNYMAPWAQYAFDWCKWTPQGKGAGKVAIGSYLEDGHNFIQILDTQLVNAPSDVYTPGSSKYSMEFTKIAEATHSYPVTRLLWEPPSSQKQSTDLLATSGDHLRLWSLPSDAQSSYSNNLSKSNAQLPINKLTPLALLSNSKTPDHTAPLTSLDWNTVSPSLIITSSIDTTCTIWDIPSLTAKTQLIAHDKEVYDVRFCANSVDVFVSCGQDGSVRMFDLRSLEHSTIIYEPTSKDDHANGGRMSPTLAQQTMSNAPPLMRLATSPHDTHLLATFAQDSNVVRILDVRQPGQALLELRGHGGSVNCIEWSPLRRGTLASGADDCQVLIWDLMNSTPSNTPAGNGPGSTDKHLTPVASWQCDYEIGNLGWTPHLANGDAGEWLGVSGGRGVWAVKI